MGSENLIGERHPHIMVSTLHANTALHLSFSWVLRVLHLYKMRASVRPIGTIHDGL